MTLLADSREKDKTLLRNSDEVTLLEYRTPAQPDKVWSYDYHLICNGDGAAMRPDKPGEFWEYRLERKTWPDYVQTWKAKDGRLERQLEAVDGFIIEFDPVSIYLEMEALRRPGMSDEELNKAKQQFAIDSRSAMKHLAQISAKMWVITSGGPDDTVHILRYLERNPPDQVKVNRIKAPDSTFQANVVRALGFNPERKMPDGRTLLESVWRHVDVDALPKALGLAAWGDYLGVSQMGKALDVIRASRVTEVAPT